MVVRKNAKEATSMIDTFREFKDTKNTNRTTLVSVLEEDFRNVLTEIHGSDENLDVIVNPDKGDLEIYRNRIVMSGGEVADENKEISLKETRKIRDDYEEGEEVFGQIDFIKLGRRAILNPRQTSESGVLELERDSLCNKYKNRVGQVTSDEIYQMWKREVLLVDDENSKLILPKPEQIPANRHRKDEAIRAVIPRVGNENNNPKITPSYISSVSLERLLEVEVPKISNGLISIKEIVRMSGERAKVVVGGYGNRIGPAGACVGVEGNRVRSIVREPCSENTDVIDYTSNIKLFIQRASSPVRINSVNLNEENRKAEVYLQPEEVSLATDWGGLNTRLAPMLTELTIGIYREVSDVDADENIYLEGSSDEIDQWIIDAIKSIGLDTTKQVLNVPHETLIGKTDLEEGTVDHLIRVLKLEFEQ